MSLETITPDETALRPAPGRATPLPEWVSTTDRNALPNVLNWASEAERPPISGRVDVTSSGFALGTATVTGYFHSSGELGCWVELDIPLTSGERRTYFFGESLTRLDQGDEPSTSSAPADSADVQDVPVVKEEVVGVVVPAQAAAPVPAAEEHDDDAITLSEDDKIELE